MRCKICGAKLKNDGDICKNCYNEYKSYENMIPKNEKELFSVKRKFRLNLPIIIIFILAGMEGFAYYNTVVGIIIAIVCLLCIVGMIYFEIKRANGTKLTLYETRLMYCAKYLCFDFEEIILYNDLNDVQCFKSFWQRISNTGDVRFYKKKLLSGVTLADMPNVNENYEEIRKIITSAISSDEQEK